MKKNKSKHKKKKVISSAPKIVQDKDWREFDEMVNREIEDLRLQYKNLGYE